MSEELAQESSLRQRFSSILTNFKIPFILTLVALILIVLGLRMIFFPINNSEIQFLEATGSATTAQLIKVDVEGAVVNPGVYSLNNDSRIQDLLVEAGGLGQNADREWIAKYLNLAGKLTDGTKIYIPSLNEKTENDTPQVAGVNISKGIVNINTASVAELDTLSGVGEVTANKIISGRPYGTIDELLTKKIVSQSVFEKIKEKIGVY